MAATNYTPIQLYYSTTASAAPTAGNLVNGELAINITDGKLYYKDNGGNVQVIATKGAGTIGGSNTQIQFNDGGALAGNAAMVFNKATNVTTLTTLNLTNALGAAYGGTAQSAYAQGDLLYASAVNTLSKLSIGTVNYILTSTGSVPQWVAPTSVTVQTANNLAGGAAGSVPYQSAADTTTFLSIGAANRVMTSTGSAPQWVTSLTGLTGVSSSSMTNTGLTSGRVVYSGASGVQTDSANLTFNGTTLSAGGFSTTGNSTLVKLVTIGDSGFTTGAVLAAATPAKLYIGTGAVTDGTSAGGATNTLGTITAFGQTQVIATNANVTYTNLATLYIAGAPTAGTNVTITNPYSLYVAGGASYFGGAVTYAGGINFNGNVTVGDSSADTLTINSTITSNLIFTDNTYDIGASGATRPRNYYGSGEITIGMGGTSTGVATRVLFNGASGTSSYSGVVASRNGTNFWYVGDYEAVGGTSGLISYTYGANPWIVSANGVEAIRVNGAATGVGIFQNNPAARLHVSGNASSSVTTLLVENSGTLASNEVIRFSIVGLTNGFRMRQDSTSALKYSFEGGKVGINLTDARSELSIAGNIGLNAGGLLNNLYYDGSNWRYAVNNAGIGWGQAGDTNQIYWLTAPASGTQDAIATVTTRMGMQSNGLLTVYTGPTWVNGGFPGALGKQINLGYDVANSIGYLRSTNNGTTGTALYLDGSEVRINIGTTTNSEVARFNASGLAFPVSSNLSTSSGYLNIQATGALILDTGSGSNMTFRVAGADSGYWNATGLTVGTRTSPSKVTITGGNASIGSGSGYLNNTYYDGAWKFLENGWGGGSYIDNAGVWNFYMSNAINASGYGAGATVGNVLSIENLKSLALQGATPQTGTGISFPASQNPATNANTLDDYEEGSWTPVYTGGGISVSYSEQIGRYIKIGRMVYFSCRLVTNSASGGSGFLRVDGLPFTSVNAGSNPGFVAITFSYNWNGAAILGMIPVANSTSLDAYTQYAAFNGNTQVNVSALTSSGSVYLIFGGCYESAV